MAEDKFGEDLLRVVAAQLHFQCGLLTAREMFGKSYFSLGVAEKVAVDQVVQTHVSSHYLGITPKALGSKKVGEAIGFGVPSPSKKS
jgi:hypothetical protein